MRLSELVDRTRALSGIRLDSVRTDDEIEGLLNETYSEVLGLQPWPFLRGTQTINVAAETENVSLPATFRYLTAVIADDTRLRQTTLDELDAMGPDEGETTLYARVTDRQIRLWPKNPEALVLTVRGQIAFDSLGSSDEPVFAEQFHPMLAYRAATRLLLEEGDDSNRAEAFQLDAAGYLRRMEEYYLGSGDIGLIRMGSQRKGVRWRS